MMRMLCPGFSAAAEVRTVRHSFITGWRFSYACYACRMIYVIASSKNPALCTTGNGCSGSSSRPIDFTWIDRKHQIVRRVHAVAWLGLLPYLPYLPVLWLFILTFLLKLKPHVYRIMCGDYVHTYGEYDLSLNNNDGFEWFLSKRK